MQNISQWIVIAHLIRPQGRRGELLADILTDFPERFGERGELFLLDNQGNLSRPITLEGNWLHKGRIVLKFAGIKTISDAEALRGLDVAIPREHRTPLDADSAYISDLIGCRVIDLSAGIEHDLGEIIAVDRETASAPLLVLNSRENGEELLIPFAKAYLRKIDTEHKHIEMSLPEGLLNINEPKQED